MLIGARTAAWGGGEKLPYDAEVEYIKSTGTQYISNFYTYTGDEQEVAIEIGVVFDTTKDYSYMLGMWQGLRGTNVAQVHKGLRMSSVGSSTRVVFFDIGKKYNLKLTWSKPDIMKVEGDLNGQITNDVSFSKNGLYLFNGNNLGSTYYALQSIEYIRIIADGEIVRDAKAVRKDGVGYLYDRVSDQLFGNAGTGEFIIGPDKAA